MQCPVCNTVQLVMSERQGIEIDYCPQCRGVWLDRGELDKIIERSVPGKDDKKHKDRDKYEGRDSYGERRPYSGDDDDHRHGQYRDEHGYHKKKKRGGFLDDLFDFG